MPEDMSEKKESEHERIDRLLRDLLNLHREDFPAQITGVTVDDDSVIVEYEPIAGYDKTAFRDKSSAIQKHPRYLDRFRCIYGRGWLFKLIL